ncbi:MAG: 2OG-Fe(II) oxygenase [Gammaproteobacteria bacterium]|nr:2OG-Fe(II) oxygenase [Gammaproteobacteria bacterium]MCP5137027.1 2OG-Fe(II) oxygenase [Gammaproteobacteria bacterium]
MRTVIPAVAAAADINVALLKAYLGLRDSPDVRRSHLFEGRWENRYVARERIPEIEPVLSAALDHARQLVGRNDLRVGFWFNETHPGQRTLIHSHDDTDELLSGVYYVTAPDQCGDLIIHDQDHVDRVVPQAGQFVFFPPDLPHEVEPHRGAGMRLSLAMNFGPQDGGEFSYD